MRSNQDAAQFPDQPFISMLSAFSVMSSGSQELELLKLRMGNTDGTIWSEPPSFAELLVGAGTPKEASEKPAGPILPDPLALPLEAA